MLSIRRTLQTGVAAIALTLFVSSAYPQDLNSLPASANTQWKLFVDETVNPLFVGAAFFNASVSELHLGPPSYGPGAVAYAERFGAEAGDITTQNFFGDYVFASLMHEDTRYRREGPGHSFWQRVGHAAASGLYTHTFSGGDTVNWSNLAGTAVSAGISNAYYAPVDRTLHYTTVNFTTSVIGAGLGNLAPEFWPDFHGWLVRHHLFPHGGK